MTRSKVGESTRNRSLIISIIGGITLLALAATVFAVASQARAVSSQAEQSVKVIEGLRVVTVSRAQLSIASRVSSVDATQTEVVTLALSEAAEALDAVEENFDEQTSAETLEVFDAYRSAATTQSELIRSGAATVEQARAAELATGERFNELVMALRDAQGEAIDGLRAANDLMNVISTIATFVVAFVVPSAALYIFEALRRTPRRARKLEHDYERTKAQSLAMSAAVATEVKNLRGAIDRLPQGYHPHELQRSALRFEHVAALNGSVRTLRNSEINIQELALEVTRSLGAHITINDSQAGDSTVYGDADQVSLVIAELLQNAIRHGSNPVTLDVVSEENKVVLSVSDQGPGLPEVIEDAIIHDNDYATRGNLISGTYGFGLLAAREATESLGGHLRYHRQDSETSIIVELPRSHHSATNTPTDISLPAALEGRAAA